MSSLRPESHVAQQIRREKLRIQNTSQHLQDFPTNIEQLSLHPGLNSDLLQVRNVRNANMLYEPAFYSSEMVNFSTPSNPLSASDEPKPSRLMIPHYASFPHSSVSDPAPSSEPRDHLGYDWMINYGSSSVVNETNNPNSNFATELNNNSVPVYQHLAKPSYNELIERQLGEMHHPSSPPPLFQNTLQDIVKSASISAQGSDHMASLMRQSGHGTWMGNHNQSNQFHFGNNSLSDSINPQGLSLSLSSNSQSKASLSGFPFGDGCGSDELYSRCGKSTKSIMKPSSVLTKDCGKSLQEVVVVASNTSGYRSNVGPLGPFTGYATILKSSRFLKPAQELLDEFCSLCGSNTIKACDGSEISRVSGEVSASTSAAEAVINATERGVSAKDGISDAGAASCSILCNPKENSGDGGARGSLGYSPRPEYQQKKAKLLYMQEEVTRKYRQYHQQMQMVVSSFESVAGLSSAAPYITMALKSVTRHCRCLKNAILDQIKHIREVLGEDLLGSTSGTTSKLDTDMGRLRYMDQSFQKSKTAFLEPQQVWRPQRGLPERAVAILKAWLFEHFLHPYPTDTDKHMLATQTGLSRNQVSNWFINARVRVWKPMVEEIHNLETKGSTGGNQNEGTSGAEGSSQQAIVEEPLNKFGRHGDAIPEKQFQCLEMSSLGGNSEGEGFIGAEHWNQEKRSKLECQIAPNMDGTLMGFVPFRRGAGLDVGGLGSVSLTLGLRHGVEGVQRQQHQQLQGEDQIRRHLGEHMIHDFVG